jgi:hypothetical protein
MSIFVLAAFFLADNLQPGEIVGDEHRNGYLPLELACVRQNT